MKKYNENKMRFEELPQEVQTEVKKVLRAYDECPVTFEYGRYDVGGGICIKKEYAADHDFIGVYYAEDIFTEEERIINYAEAFHEFSPLYKGKRDYTMWHKVGYDWSVKFKIENGELKIA